METFVYNDGGRAAAGYKGDAGDCVTRSIAIATGLPYQQVYDDLSARVKAHSNAKIQKAARNGKPWPTRKVSARDGVPKEIGKEYLAELGWTWTPTMGIGTGCTVHLRGDELPSGRLIASTSRHLVAVIDGVIHDTYDPSREGTRCVYGYWTK